MTAYFLYDKEWPDALRVTVTVEPCVVYRNELTI